MGFKSNIIAYFPLQKGNIPSLLQFLFVLSYSFHWRKEDMNEMKAFKNPGTVEIQLT